MGASQTVVPKPIGEALVWARIRLREHQGCSPNKRFDGIMNVGMFKQAYENNLCLFYLNVSWEWIFCWSEECLPYQVL